jgi:hypothetical protein
MQKVKQIRTVTACNSNKDTSRATCSQELSAIKIFVTNMMNEEMGGKRTTTLTKWNG